MTDPAASPRSSASLPLKNIALIAVAVVCGLGAGYLFYRQSQNDTYDYGPIAFKDDAQSNAELGAADIAALPLFDADSKPVDLKQFQGKKNVVLVITRGWTGGAKQGTETQYVGNVCIYCATQTAALAANYDKFKSRDAEVVVVFPVAKKAGAVRLKDFEKAVAKQGGPAAPPFPLTLDLELQAVDLLGIRQDLSKPATYLLDKQGKVRFAYVGKSLADRPSVKAVLAQLDNINAAN